jgi:hypothetical protein
MDTATTFGALFSRVLTRRSLLKAGVGLGALGSLVATGCAPSVRSVGSTPGAPLSVSRSPPLLDGAGYSRLD